MSEYGAQGGAILFFSADDVPEAWRARANSVLMVPLLPEEAADFLPHSRGTGGAFGEDEDFLSGVASGLSAPDLASRFDISVRSVERRLASLRRRTGVSTTVELVAFLARRGF